MDGYLQKRVVCQKMYNFVYFLLSFLKTALLQMFKISVCSCKSNFQKPGRELKLRQKFGLV